MKTNYKKLTGFESALIVVIAAGFLIFGFEIYLGLPQPLQASLKQSFAILDLHDSAKQEMEDVKIFSDLMLDVYDNFNLAFIQTMTIEEEWAELRQTARSTYKTTLALLNEWNETSVALASYEGQVLGISVGDQTVCGEIEPEFIRRAQVQSNNDRQQIYTLPELNSLAQLLNNFALQIN